MYVKIPEKQGSFQQLNNVICKSGSVACYEHFESIGSPVHLLFSPPQCDRVYVPHELDG